MFAFLFFVLPLIVFPWVVADAYKNTKVETKLKRYHSFPLVLFVIKNTRTEKKTTLLQGVLHIKQTSADVCPFFAHTVNV